MAAWDYGVSWRMGWDRGGAAKGTNEGRGQNSRFSHPRPTTRPRLSVGDTAGGLVPQTVTFSGGEICVRQWRKPLLILCRQAWLVWMLPPTTSSPSRVGAGLSVPATGCGPIRVFIQSAGIFPQRPAARSHSSSCSQLRTAACCRRPHQPECAPRDYHVRTADWTETSGEKLISRAPLPRYGWFSPDIRTPAGTLCVIDHL